MLNNKINSDEIDKIGNFTKEEKNFRLKNLNYFNDIGFPNKKNEDWKFSDLNAIVSKNFSKLDIQFAKTKKQKVDFIKDFEHNYLLSNKNTPQHKILENTVINIIDQEHLALYGCLNYFNLTQKV